MCFKYIQKQNINRTKSNKIPLYPPSQFFFLIHMPYHSENILQHLLQGWIKPTWGPWLAVNFMEAHPHHTYNNAKLCHKSDR